MLTRNVRNSQESFVTPAIKGTWLNFSSFFFLGRYHSKFCTRPNSRERALTSGAAWMVVRSKSRLLGWQGQKEPAATKRCDTSWRSCSTECRQGSKSRLTVVGFIRPMIWHWHIDGSSRFSPSVRARETTSLPQDAAPYECASG